MEKLKPGTIVTITQECRKWGSEHADESYSFPESFIRDPEYAKENVTNYLMWKYSYVKQLPIDGVIIGDNGFDEDLFAYLVWCVNEIGEDITYIDPKDFEVIG